MAGALSARYRPHLQCRRGCFFCCDQIAVLPIEFEAVRRSLRDSSGAPPRRRPLPERCRFLGAAGACTIYDHRPIICRAHGLPLSYRLTEFDQAGNVVVGDERSDRWCDLNFRDIPDEHATAYFDRAGRIDMAALQDALAALNAEFLTTGAGRRYRGLGWIHLR